MTPEEIFALPQRVLSQAQRERYFEHGYAGVKSLVPGHQVAELLRVTEQFVVASRSQSKSGHDFDLGPRHSPDRPVLRRLKRPDEQHDAYWNFASGLMADVAADLLGPDVLFHHSKLNFSPSSRSPMPRPLLLNCYSAADARAYTAHPDPSRHAYEQVRGEPAGWARHDGRPCQIPPDWSGGYTFIFAAQAGEG